MNKAPVLGNAIPVLGVEPKRATFLVIFPDMPMFSHII